jgi:hypothetical protein
VPWKRRYTEKLSPHEHIAVAFTPRRHPERSGAESDETPLSFAATI